MLWSWCENYDGRPWELRSLHWDLIISIITSPKHKSSSFTTILTCFLPCIFFIYNFSSILLYRPVSNLSFISKILEKVVAECLRSHKTSENLYEPVQSAYRAGHSMETAVVRVQIILEAINVGKCVFLILLDLSAAFDTVSHDILLDRLSTLASLALLCRGSHHISLIERSQCLRLGSTLVQPNLCYGVPQGSVLGPALFSGYSSPVASLIRSFDVTARCYADDTQLYVAFTPGIDEAKRTSWSNGPFTSVPCSTGPQKWPMKHWSPFSSAPWSQNLMPHLTQQRLMQPSNSCKQARLRDQMEYQPRCSKPVVKPLSLTLPGCSKCSGSMASSHGTSGMPTSSTCTKTRVIAHPATTTAGSASSALQARYWPVSFWTGSPSTYWMMLCLRASVASESRGARWIWSLLSGSSRKNVSSSTKTSTCSSSISPRHSTLWTELHSGRYSASLDAHLDLYRSSAPSMMACFAGS